MSRHRTFARRARRRVARWFAPELQEELEETRRQLKTARKRLRNARAELSASRAIPEQVTRTVAAVRD